MRRQRLPALLAVVIAMSAGLTACGDDSSDSFTPPPDPTISVGPTADDQFASIKALHVCFVQRSALPDLGEIQADLDRRLEAADVTPEQYAAFEGRADVEPALRTLVLDYYHAACGPSPSPASS